MDGRLATRGTRPLDLRCQRVARARPLLYGALGVLIFSGSLPATRIAVETLSPDFVTYGRAVVAGLISLVLAALGHAPRPASRDLPSLVVVAGAVVIGFPLFTGLALTHVTSAHAITFVGLLPIVTAIFGAWRGGERPGRSFWFFAAAGAGTVAVYLATQSSAATASGDVDMILAILICGVGYAEGGRLARRFGGWPVIVWALILSLPLTVPLTAHVWPRDLSVAGARAWLAFAYVSLFSMLIGFVFWYRGLAAGGIAAIGQLQLVQPFLSFALAWALLGEALTPAMLGCALVVMLCVAGSRRRAPAPAMAPRLPVPAAALGIASMPTRMEDRR